MAKKTSLLIVLILLLSFSNEALSQITISKVDEIAEQVIIKPEPFDSLKGWEYPRDFREYKKYIGQQIYLPPFKKPQIGNPNQRDFNPFLFTLTPHTINLSKVPKNLLLIERALDGSMNWDTIAIYDKVLTTIHKPFHYASKSKIYDMDRLELFITHDETVGNKYYTIIDIVFGDELNNIYENWKSVINVETKKQEELRRNRKNFKKTFPKVFIQPLYKLNTINKSLIGLLILDNETGDTILSIENQRIPPVNRFILVANFVKHKKLYENQSLIYENTGFSTVDIRKTKSNEYIEVNRNSKWFCKEVTLLEPHYSFSYVLQNKEGDLISVNKIDGFSYESEVIKREEEKALAEKQLAERRQKEEQVRYEQEQKRVESHRLFCVEKFGKEKGELIAQGKVSIGMTKEMCRLSWGEPIWISKTTTEYSKYEDWYYGFITSLHFTDDKLTRIEQ
jgi:hypothetical protein